MLSADSPFVFLMTRSRAGYGLGLPGALSTALIHGSWELTRQGQVAGPWQSRSGACLSYSCEGPLVTAVPRDTGLGEACISIFCYFVVLVLVLSSFLPHRIGEGLGSL